MWGEREVTSQQAVDGSLVSLHCWSADFEDTLGNTADSTRRHRRRQQTTTKHSMAPQMAVLVRRSLVLKGKTDGAGRMAWREDERGE